MLFPLGNLLATPTVLRHLESARIDPVDLVRRHASGDFGDLCVEDRAANSHAIEVGHRVLSAYVIRGEKIYVITEADRSCTTVLLASEY